MLSDTERKKPVTLGRKELYERVWSTPMTKLAAEFQISDVGLAKICKRMEIPCPPRGYWARKEAGQSVVQQKLAEPSKGVHLTVTITPTPPAAPIPEIPETTRAQMESARAKVAMFTVPDRLTRPHPIVAEWIAERENLRREARSRRGSFGYAYDPGEFTDVDRRQHRILSALFKAVERVGGKVRAPHPHQLLAEFEGESIEFTIRQKQRQVRRPLTAEEKRSSYNRGKEFVTETKTTDVLVFRIKTYLPGRLRHEWLETDEKPLETMLPEIVTTFVAAGPLLVQQRLEREEARQRQIEEQKRQERRQAKKRDDNRWHLFGRFAKQARDVDLARAFLASLKANASDPTEMAGDKAIGEWIAWAEERIERDDPRLRNPKDIFSTLSAVSEWNYTANG